MIHEKHTFDLEKGTLVKTVRKQRHLNAWESFFISTESTPLMNKNDPPIQSPLFMMSLIDLK